LDFAVITAVIIATSSLIAAAYPAVAPDAEISRFRHAAIMSTARTFVIGAIS
jgi:hypothetical protein